MEENTQENSFVAEVKELAILAKQKHSDCHDSRFSCPKQLYWNQTVDSDAIICDCGADQHNKKVEELEASILKATIG